MCLKYLVMSFCLLIHHHHHHWCSAYRQVLGIQHLHCTLSSASRFIASYECLLIQLQLNNILDSHLITEHIKLSKGVGY